MNDVQNITKGQLGKMEAAFLAKAGTHPTFTLAFARQMLGHTKDDPTPQFLERLQRRAGYDASAAGDSPLFRFLPAKTVRRNSMNLWLPWSSYLRQ